MFRNLVLVVPLVPEELAGKHADLDQRLAEVLALEHGRAHPLERHAELSAEVALLGVAEPPLLHDVRPDAVVAARLDLLHQLHPRSLPGRTLRGVLRECTKGGLVKGGLAIMI